jgi:heparin/heparan-sulfate lyase
MTPATVEGQQVVAGHPRIYLRPADLPALRVRITQPPISTYYSQMRSRMDGSSSRHTNNEVAGFELESLALLHAIAGGTTYRDKILNTWRFTSYAPGQITHWDLPYQVMGHALALDYLWNDISAGQRTELGNVIVAMMDDLYNYAPYNVTFANQMSDYSNQLYYHLGALAFAGIALAGEGINDARAQFYLSEAAGLLNDHMIPAMNQEAGGDADLPRRSGFVGNGGWGEDMGHLDMTHPLLGRMVEAWRTGVNENLFPAFNGLAKYSQYVVYMRRPGGSLSPKGNGTYQTGMSDKNYGTLGSLLSARYNDPLGRFIKDVTYSGPTFGFHQLGAILWYNQTLPAPAFPGMPKAMHFQGQGEVVMRSGFGAQDTWVYLRSGPIYNGHQHDDQGNLLVEAYGGELLVENAGSGINHETVFHNSIRVGGSDQIQYGNNEVQRARPMAGTPQERGRITSVVTDPRFTYAATDFSNAYTDSVVPVPKAGKVTREVVTILPDVVIVRDRVTGVNPEVLFHAWGGAAALNASTRELTVTHNGGHAWLKTVLPVSATTLLAAQGPTDLLTVRATSAGLTSDFLHMVYVSPASTRFVPGQLTAIDTGSQIGVSFVDRQGQRWSVAFQRNGVGLAGVTSGAALSAPTGLRLVR